MDERENVSRESEAVELCRRVTTSRNSSSSPAHTVTNAEGMIHELLNDRRRNDALIFFRALNKISIRILDTFYLIDNFFL